MRAVTITMLAALVPTAVAGAQADLASTVEQLNAKDGRSRSQAIQLLRRESPAKVVKRMRKQVASFEPRGIDAAMAVIRSYPFEEIEAQLRTLAKAETPQLRAGAAAIMWRGLSGFGNERKLKKYAQSVAVAIREAVPERKLDVVRLSTACTAPEVVLACRACLDFETRGGIAVGILRDLIQREGGVSEETLVDVEPLLESKDKLTCAAALAYMCRDRSDAGRDAQLARLYRESDNTFFATQDLLGSDRALGEPIVDAVAQLLAAPRSKHVIPRLVNFLQAQSADVATRALRKLVGHEKAEFRKEALDRLANIPGGLRTPALQQMLREGTTPARIVAADTLRKRDDDSGLEVLMQLAKKAPAKHRSDLAEALAGFRSLAAMPALLDMMNDKDAAVRRHAWTGFQNVCSARFPYRRFRWQDAGYDPNSSDRTTGLAALREWWREASARLK
ncbi:MAG: HEAT repeat domain-containing protein [Planctomycetota bacterium]